MLIGELVKRTGLSKDTIRFYEKQALITVSKRERRDNNYKEYSEDILHRLTTIKRLKNFGFTLNEVSDLLKMMDYNEASCENVKDKIADRVGILDEKIREMMEVRTMLMQGAQQCQTGCSPQAPDGNCAILVSDSTELYSIIAKCPPIRTEATT